jgi:hypothetical protein
MTNETKAFIDDRLAEIAKMPNMISDRAFNAEEIEYFRETVYRLTDALSMDRPRIYPADANAVEVSFDLEEFPWEWDIDIFFDTKTFYATNWEKDGDWSYTSESATFDEVVTFLRGTKLYSRLNPAEK